MPDSVKSRGSATAKPAPAGPPRRNPGGQPLRTKADKRAEAKAAKARARAMRKRRQALAIGGAAVVVLALVVGLIVWVSRSSPPPAAAPASAAASPGPADSSPAFPPLPPNADPALSKKPAVTAGKGTVSKLTTTTLIQGAGVATSAGQTINVNYVGVTFADGKEFDSSWSRSEPFSFQVGAGNVIKGWDQGLAGVKVGSRVQLDIPADLAYGDDPSGGRPAGTLRFVIDVLSAA